MITADAIDVVRSQMATIQNELDELARNLRIARGRSDSEANEIVTMQHRMKSISSAVTSVYIELEKMDAALLLTTQATEGTT